MPFCEPCDRFYNPNTLLVDGSCPRCSTVIVEPHDDQPDEVDHDASSVPWHFWLVLGLVGLYLAWRVIQAVWWVINRVL